MPIPPPRPSRIDDRLTALAREVDSTAVVEIRDGAAWLVQQVVGVRRLGTTRREAREKLAALNAWLLAALAGIERR